MQIKAAGQSPWLWFSSKSESLSALVFDSLGTSLRIQRQALDKVSTNNPLTSSNSLTSQLTSFLTNYTTIYSSYTNLHQLRGLIQCWTLTVLFRAVSANARISIGCNTTPPCHDGKDILTEELAQESTCHGFQDGSLVVNQGWVGVCISKREVIHTEAVWTSNRGDGRTSRSAAELRKVHTHQCLFHRWTNVMSWQSVTSVRTQRERFDKPRTRLHVPFHPAF